MMMLLFSIDYEMNIFQFESMFESLYCSDISMTTVGYGDVSPKSYFGQISFIVGIGLGVILEGLFLVAWSIFTKFD